MTYDRDGLPVKVGHLSLTRDLNGKVTASSLNNVNEQITYDNFGAMTDDRLQIGRHYLSAMHFERDSIGRIVVLSNHEGEHEGGRNRGFEYDKQGRLTKVYEGRHLKREYLFDANGNRIAKIENGRTVTEGRYDAQDRLIGYGNTEYQFNANGELFRKIEHRGVEDEHGRGNEHGHCHHRSDRITNYAFDSFGYLKAVALPNGKVIEYMLDGQNRRVGKKINGRLVQSFVYESQTQIAAELDVKCSGLHDRRQPRVPHRLRSSGYTSLGDRRRNRQSS